MARRWAETVEEHRSSVRDAVLDAAAELVAERGLTAVTMAGIAEATGIARATLYRYYPDVDAVLAAWHERQVNAHVAQLSAVIAASTEPLQQLRNALTAYAQLAGGHGGTQNSIAAALHRGPQVAEARGQVGGLVADVLQACLKAGVVRDDVPVEELVAYCLGALGAVGRDSSGANVHRLVGITLDALRPSTV